MTLYVGSRLRLSLLNFPADTEYAHNNELSVVEPEPQIFCLSGTGSGFGTGFGSGFNTKGNSVAKKSNKLQLSEKTFLFIKNYARYGLDSVPDLDPDSGTRAENFLNL